MFLISLAPALDISLANLIIATAAQAANGMGLNLFAVPLLAFIDPVYVPGPEQHPDAVSAICSVSVTSSARMVVHSFQAMM